MAKRSSLLLAFILSLSLVGMSPSLADDQPRQKNSKSSKAERVAPGPRCEQTSAVAHAPVEVPVPERVFTPRQLQRMMKQIILETNCGEIVIQPNYRAPVALTALHALIRGGFFDESLCHRLTTEKSFLLQCGDPTATGKGGPNFTYELETPQSEFDRMYPEGVVALFNTGTPGSQFFIAYQDSILSPNHTIFGRVVRGLDIVKMIARAGVRDGSSDGTPRQTIAIEEVSIR